jgi:hypothetical protein
MKSNIRTAIEIPFVDLNKIYLYMQNHAEDYQFDANRLSVVISGKNWEVGKTVDLELEEEISTVIHFTVIEEMIGRLFDIMDERGVDPEDLVAYIDDKDWSIGSA